MQRAKIVTAFLVLVVGGLSSGCSYNRRRGWEFRPVEAVFDGLVDRKSDTDKLWEQGYGYNNPNAARR